MSGLSSQQFIDSFYKNKKIKSSSNFPLLKKEWAEVQAQLSRIVGWILFAPMTLAAIVGLIFTPIHFSKVDNIILLGFANALVFAALLAIPSLIFAVLYGALKSDYDEAFIFQKQGVPKSLVYALRGWVNARFEMQLTNADAVSLLTEPRTPYEGNQYKLVFSSDLNSIIDLVVDNSCPADCCGKEKVDAGSLQETEKAFKL